MKTINQIGLEEIRIFLAENHKLGEAFTQDMLNAWVADAEFQMAEGNLPSIEIKSWDSIHGYTQEYTISKSGIDE
jgi:bifunctional pyridoxal-dependent enzyme with beta-cystathionase and maltose regulon repressor activities